MSEAIFAIYGASGFGRETMAFARSEATKRGAAIEDIYFVDDKPRSPIVNGQRVLTYAEFVRLPAARRLVALAIADSKIRERLANQCEADGLESWAIQAANSVVLDDVEVGEGAILSPFSMLTSNIRIGCYFHANIYSYVAHDCVIGDFVTFAPGVKCNGNIIIEDHAYIGTGAILKQGRPGKPLVVGKGAVVGMGAVVTKDVMAGEVVVGNPARRMAKD
ncbi:acetyltransferase [Hyphomicrobium sp.]|uniref:acetyltransferase n=1 Tax=Hyphomicrobium sp. TaxID=82 RepID=UPI002FE07433